MPKDQGMNEEQELAGREQAIKTDFATRQAALQSEIDSGASQAEGHPLPESKGPVTVNPLTAMSAGSSSFGAHVGLNPLAYNSHTPERGTPTVTLQMLQKGLMKFKCPDCEANYLAQKAEADCIGSVKEKKARLYELESGVNDWMFKFRADYSQHIASCERNQKRVIQETVQSSNKALLEGLLPSLAATMAQAIKEALKE